MSGKAQVGGDGIPRQRTAIAGYAKKKGVAVLEEFADAGVSGTEPLLARPALSRLLASVTQGDVSMVLVEKADRLARDLVEGELILREFRRAGVAVVEVEGGTDLTEADSSNPTAVLIRQVLGAVAEFEKSAIVAKLRAARDRVREREGRCEGPREFGQLEGEAVALARILALSRKPRGRPRLSLREIAKRLDDEGVSTRTGVSWSPTTVRAILRRHGKR